MKDKIYFIELNEDKKYEEYKQYISLLPLAKQQQIDKFRYDIDKKLSLIADLFIRFLICQNLNLHNKEISFEKNSFGKPYLLGNAEFHFNISHTRNAVAIGISSNPIGVDIEKIKCADLKIAERFFCSNELEYILSNKQDRFFYEIWTKKEAYIKWDGRGLSIPLDSFDVTESKIDKILHTITIHDYIISICSRQDFSGTWCMELTEDSVLDCLQKLS
jgi:4'-phosphopantetheinyl transferase